MRFCSGHYLAENGVTQATVLIYILRCQVTDRAEMVPDLGRIRVPYLLD